MDKSPVFIVGSYRSGVNFLSTVLETSPELSVVHDEMLERKIYESVLLKKHDIEIVNRYRVLYQTTQGRMVHANYPTLWNHSMVRDIFPNAKFLCMIRDPFSIIRSMATKPLTKELLDGDNWKRYGDDHQFLGIDHAFVNNPAAHDKLYNDFSLYEKCALRWVTYVKKINDLAKHDKDTFMPIVFERLVFDGEKHCKKIAKHLQLSTIPIVNNPDTTVIDKRKDFTDKERNDITRLIMNYFRYYGDVDERLFPLKLYFTPDM